MCWVIRRENDRLEVGYWYTRDGHAYFFECFDWYNDSDSGKGKAIELCSKLNGGLY